MTAPVYTREVTPAPSEPPVAGTFECIAWALTPFALALGMLLLGGAQ